MSTKIPNMRDDSRERSESRMVKHQHSFSETGRFSVPMWDSSDPDRAPPPLPLNPGATGSPITRSNTSARIEEAAALITARARENAPSSYTTNPTASTSPDKNIMKPQHRRMQTIQSPSIGRLSDSLERRSPEKGLRTSKTSDLDDFRSSRSYERSPVRSGSETPTPVGRSTPRTSVLENGSPVLALQTIRKESSTPLGDITNGLSSSSQGPYSLEALSSQILSLTSVATNLQRELNSLNRRSKDNASDLSSLREASTSRDEEIRNSLRDLVAGLDQRLGSLDSRLLTGPEASRSTPNLGLYLDDKAHNASPNRKNFSLPRIPSPASFTAAMDRDLTASPSLAYADGAASIALLEKVLREMATKDGQDAITETLEKVRSQAQAKSQSSSSSQPVFDPAVMKKLEDILSFLKSLKEDTGSRALVRSGATEAGRPRGDLYIDDEAKPGPLARVMNDKDRRSSAPGGSATDFVNDEIMKMLKSVKQSLSQGGGLTNEVKALVRELRGEVLGMGRDIARKLDENDSTSRALVTEPQGPGRAEIGQIVDQALAELKEHMHQVIRESRRESSTAARSTVDTQEVVLAVRSALAEMPQPQEAPVRDLVSEREEMITAVREAWEDCKPEIALEHFGLERDEILQTLKEGLKSYQPQQSTAREAAATYDDVLDAIRKGLSDFKTPAITTEAGITREELLVTVRECLESFEWPTHSLNPSRAGDSDMTRTDIVDAVRDGLSQQAPVSKEIEFNREDLFDAIKACLEGEQNPLGGMGERVVEAMHEFLGSMKTEFQQYSAANGKDTEQVLDAMKDGLEDLRAEIESYVDRAADVTGKDEIIDTLKEGFTSIQVDLDKGFATRGNQGATNTPELLDAMEKEFQHLRETINKTLIRTSISSEKDDILDAIRDLSDDRQSAVSSNNGEDIVRLVKEELEHMRTTLAGTLIRGGSSFERDDVIGAVREGLELHRSQPRSDGSESVLSNTSELLDAFQDGVDGIRADMQKLMGRNADSTSSFEILDALKTGIEDVRADIQNLHQKQTESSETATTRGREVVVHDENMISTEIESLKVMITQLRIKVEALDNAPIPPSTESTEAHIHRDDLDEIHNAIQSIRETVNSTRDMPGTVPSTNTASKDDTDAIETLLRNVKAQLDEVVMPGMESAAKTIHLDSVQDALNEIKFSIDESTKQSRENSDKEDFTIIELLLKEVQDGVEGLKVKVNGLVDDDGLLSKNEIQVVESLCMDIKTQLHSFKFPEFENLPTQEDIDGLKDSIKAFRDQVEADTDLTAQAFEARKIEHGGIATKIDDVKAVIGELRDELIGKLNGSEDGIVELNKVLGMHHENMDTYATAASVTELSDLIKSELERHMDYHSSSKTEMEERDSTLFTKHEETSSELKGVIETKFDELMTKYDDAQLSHDALQGKMEESAKSHLEMTTSAKTVVDDLRSVVDTLGSTITETCERMSDDAKTVFTRVDEANAKIGEIHSANAFEHGVTREEITKAVTAISRLEGHVGENQPAVLAAIREVLDAVNQHYEHSQQHTENFARATEEIKSGVNSIPSSIPTLLPPPPSPDMMREIPAQKEYDDTQVHDKLNNLISHAAIAKEVFARIENHHQDSQKSLSNLDKLDEIHNQVMTTASEISAMVATQTRLMAEEHDSKATEATEAAIALEKRTAQKEKVEADIVSLTQEKNMLVESMAALRREQEELNGQTKRLSREVAKLETALKIRHEEMRDMNDRAEGLERRILEGLMNHARSVKNSKPSAATKITPAQRDAAMSLKRVPSTASTITSKTSVKDGSSAIGNAVGMALKKRTPLGSSANSNVSSRASGVDRRILSTSHVTGNRGRDTPERCLVLAPSPKGKVVSLKRSHSVKSNPSSYLDGRKPSWNGVDSGVDSSLHDKENYSREENVSDDEGSSDAGTERRTSYGGTSVMYTDSMTYGTGSTVSSNSGRTVSYASSIGGTLNGHTESIAEEDEEDNQGDEVQADTRLALAVVKTEAPTTDVDNSMALTMFGGTDSGIMAADTLSELQPPALITDYNIKYHQASDSGLGTEPPTADQEQIGEAQEYFNMSRQEMKT